MSQKREIECLMRLQELSSAFSEILYFLVDEKLITADHAKSVQQNSDKARSMHTCLHELNKQEKFQLMEFTWEILPIERIKINLVTDRNSREFTWNF